MPRQFLFPDIYDWSPELIINKTFKSPSKCLSRKCLPIIIYFVFLTFNVSFLDFNQMATILNVWIKLAQSSGIYCTHARSSLDAEIRLFFGANRNSFSSDLIFFLRGEKRRVPLMQTAKVPFLKKKHLYIRWKPSRLSWKKHNWDVNCCKKWHLLDRTSFQVIRLHRLKTRTRQN